jgi:hypothetical protein
MQWPPQGAALTVAWALLHARGPHVLHPYLLLLLLLQAEHTAEHGWGKPRIVPFGPLQLHPGAQVLHYGMCCFEGMKAYLGQDGRVRLFRWAAAGMLTGQQQGQDQLQQQGKQQPGHGSSGTEPLVRRVQPGLTAVCWARVSSKQQWQTAT